MSDGVEEFAVSVIMWYLLHLLHNIYVPFILAYFKDVLLIKTLEIYYFNSCNIWKSLTEMLGSLCRAISATDTRIEKS